MINLVNICKKYEEYTLENINIDIRNGEKLAIIGHNGSGKSTLLSVITGLTKPSSGQILINGEEKRFASLYHAKENGFQLLEQKPAIFPHLSILENMFVGFEPVKKILGLSFIDKREMQRRGKKVLGEIGIDILNLNRPIGTLSGGQIAVVCFMRLLNKLPVLLALDEPTAALGPKERFEVNKVINKFASLGVAIVFVTHILSDVITLADKVAILKEGKLIYYNSTSNLKENDILKFME